MQRERNFFNTLGMRHCLDLMSLAVFKDEETNSEDEEECMEEKDEDDEHSWGGIVDSDDDRDHCIGSDNDIEHGIGTLREITFNNPQRTYIKNMRSHPKLPNGALSS